jgi:hypothetical protein
VDLRELAEYLDSDLENANYHAFVGVNVYILKSLESIADSSTAKKFLWKLFQDGGLEGAAMA